MAQDLHQHNSGRPGCAVVVMEALGRCCRVLLALVTMLGVMTFGGIVVVVMVLKFALFDRWDRDGEKTCKNGS